MPKKNTYGWVNLEELLIQECEPISYGFPYAICWYDDWFGGEYDLGHTIGAVKVPAKRAKNPDAYEVSEMARVAKETGGRLGRYGFGWMTKDAAEKSLKAMNRRLKEIRKKPLPKWAQEALANGWEPRESKTWKTGLSVP